MEVYVGNLLSRSVAVSQEEVDALAFKVAAAQRFCHTLSYTEQVSSRLLIELSERRGVMDGNDQDVPRIDGLYVHEGPAPFVFEDDAGGTFSRYYVAEGAGGHDDFLRKNVL